MVDLEPDKWKEMDRVWFLELRSPELRAHRKSLGLPELPVGEDGDHPFHITVAARKRSQNRGESTLDGMFNGTQQSNANADLVKVARAEALWLRDALALKCEHVRGHIGILGNELADKCAVAAASGCCAW